MQYLNKKTLLALALLIIVCASCGPQIIKGRPPFISIDSMTLQNEELTAIFSLSNQNGEPMEINGIEITVTVEDATMTRYNEEFQMTVGANSTENVTVEQLPDEFTRDLLVSLEGGDVISLPFELDGRVRTVGDGSLKFRNKGHLYPVPGRPGQFRSATTHSSQIDGEDPFKVIENRQ